jgi:hypothetical protein
MSAQLALVPFARPLPLAPQRVVLPDPALELQAQTRKAILDPILAYRPNDSRFTSLRLKDGKPVTSLSRMVAYVSETSGQTENTLYRWLRAYKQGGRPALADRQRRDKGASRFFDSYPKAKWLAAYIYWGDPEFPAQRQLPGESRQFGGQSIRAAHEAILRDLDLLEIPPQDAPSYETVRAWLRSGPTSLGVYARQGKKAYRDRMAPYLRRAYTDIFAGQCWVGDHMIHDIFGLNDTYEDLPEWARIRLRLTDFIDYRSRMVMATSWAVEGSSSSLAAAGRRGILRFGPAEMWYLDNGKDMQKVARGAEAGFLADRNWWREELSWIESTGFLARVGIGVTFCLPHHPQAKHVERFHRTVHERYDKAWPGYTSGSPFTRPDIATVAIEKHTKLMKAGRGGDSTLPLVSQIIAGCLAWVEEYNATPHTGQGMDGGTPAEVFAAYRNPNQKPAPDAAALALLMKDRTTRLVRECAVTLDKRRYVPDDPGAWKLMHFYETERNGGEIMIAFDRRIPECVDVLDLDGNYIATLQAETLMRFAPSDPQVRQQIAGSMRTRRGLEKQTREGLRLVSQTARANGAQSPLEAMAARLRLPAGETGADIVTQRKPAHSHSQKTAEKPMTPAQVARLLLEEE